MGHVLPSALADLSLAMASACTAGDGSNDDDSNDEEAGGVEDYAADGPGGGITAAATAAAADPDVERGGGKAATAPREGEGPATEIYSEGEATAGVVAGGVEPAAAEAEAPARFSTENGAASSDGALPLAASAAHGQGKPLFRAVGSVDPDTAHLNAGFDALEKESLSAENGGGSCGTAAEVGLEGSWDGESSYCMETRARLLVPLVSLGEGRQRPRWQPPGQRVVFDVCSIDPAGTTALV